MTNSLETKLFDAYNDCDLTAFDGILSHDLEPYATKRDNNLDSA
jgi:hypothetical protein